GQRSTLIPDVHWGCIGRISLMAYKEADVVGASSSIATGQTTTLCCSHGSHDGVRRGMADLSFEAESPVMPPAELLEGLPSYDWLLRGRGRQVFFPSLEVLGRSPEPASWSSVLEHSRVPVVTEEVAREALLSFVNSQCCYSSAAAGNLIIQELRQQSLCRYRLETFSESRVSEWTFQPVTNHSVDGPQRGASPRLWDMKVQVPPMFQEDTRKFQVPHSSLVKVYPIVDFPLRDISLASQRGIEEHNTALASRARILQQRQTIELIPITEVHYWYQGKTSVYYIYGTDHQIPKKLQFQRRESYSGSQFERIQSTTAVKTLWLEQPEDVGKPLMDIS
ncbi:hypothetical protein STEG23_033352, partial [Scotinomys teguina]